MVAPDRALVTPALNEENSFNVHTPLFTLSTVTNPTVNESRSARVVPNGNVSMQARGPYSPPLAFSSTTINILQHEHFTTTICISVVELKFLQTLKPTPSPA